MEWAVRAKGLTKRYGEFTAVDGIDLEVPLGVCFGILGTEWCGKDDHHSHDHLSLPARRRQAGGARTRCNKRCPPY